MSNGSRVRYYAPSVDLAVKRNNSKKIEQFARPVKDVAAWYCGGYSTSEHKHIIERTATRGRFNHILHYSGISYPLREVPEEAKAIDKKRKRSSSCQGCAVKRLAKKAATRTDLETSPEREVGERGLLSDR